MIITDRDRKIIHYLDRFKYATTKNLADLFFIESGKNYYIIALKRLKKLVANNKIKCITVNNNKIGRPMTVYYLESINKSNARHALAIAEFTAALIKNNVDIVELSVEQYFTKKIRVDAVYKVIYNNKKRLFIVEFDITKKFNVTKYEYFKKSGEWKDYFKVFPRIVSVTNNKISKSDIVNIININENLDNINILLELIR